MRIVINSIVLFIASLFLIQAVGANSVETKKTALSEVNKEIQHLKNTIQQNQQQSTTLQQQLKIAELTISALNEQMTRLNHELIAQQKILNELTLTEQVTHAKLKMQNDALSELLRAAYQLGVHDPLKMIFNEENINASNRYIIYYKTLNEARAKLIMDIEQNLVVLQKTLEASKTHQRILKNAIAQKERQQIDQQHLLATRQQLMAALGLQTENKQRKIALLIANQKILQDTITHLAQQKTILTGQPFDQLKGRLSWPVNGPFAVSFGSNMNGNLHSNGVEIKAPMGAPVHAIYSGKVVFADWLRGFGLLVIINHGDQYMSLYARNQAIYIKSGDLIKTGDIIAKTGNSGGYNYSGLYFEIRQQGVPIDPRIWCR